MLLVVAHLARAGCGEEAPPLHLGDAMWSVSGGAWVGPTSTVDFRDGFAFEVRDDHGPVGVIFAGRARLHTVDPDGQLADALARELEIHVPPGGWDVPVDIAWSTGSTALPGWLPLRLDGSGSLSVDLPDMETVLVVGHRDLQAARSAAGRALVDRAIALSGSGYPLVSMLHSHSAGWRLTEARTPYPVGAMAGMWTGTADPWLTVLEDDPLLDGGRRAATVSLGTRYVEGLSGA